LNQIPIALYISSLIFFQLFYA